MMYSSEEIFAALLDSKGMGFSYQPMRFHLKNTTYKPDFYCPDNDTFYEVIGTRQAYHLNKRKIKEFIETYHDIKFEIIKSSGEKYLSNRKERKYKKRIFIKQSKDYEGLKININFRLSSNLKKEVLEISQKCNKTTGFICRKALNEFLKEGKS